MKKKNLFTILLLLAVVTLYCQEKNSIAGNVKTSDGIPARQIKLVIDDFKIETQSDEKGYYKFDDITLKQELKISLYANGIVVHTETIKVISGHNVVNFTLASKVTELNEVIIKGVGFNRFIAKESQDVAKIPLKNTENPQVYSVIPKEIIKAQLIIDNKDIINNAAGVVAFNNPTGAVTAWIRGFETRNAVRNGMATQFRAETDPINIERVEVIKGPSGTLYGANAVSFGGLINKVTKTPNDVPKSEATVFAGSYGLLRFTLDANKPLNDNKTALFRINASHSDQETFQDIGYAKNTTIAPSFLYKVSDRFQILAEAELATISRTQQPYPFFTSGVTFTNFKDIPISYKKYVGGNDVDSKTNITNLFLKGTYKISDSWTSTTNVNSSKGYVDYSYQLYPRWVDDHTIIRNVGLYSGRKLSYFQLQQNFNGDFKLGSIRNRVLAGTDYTQNSTQLNFTWAQYDQIDINTDFAPIIKAKIDGILATKNAGHWDNTQSSISAYFSDVINFTPRLSAMLSARVDHFINSPSIENNVKVKDDFEQTFLSPKIGMVYEIVKNNVFVFGNYMNGFINQGPVDQPDGSQFRLAPKEANQKELGVKTEFSDKRVSTTLSAYEIKIDNATWVDALGFTQQKGEQKSKGFEFEVTSQLTNNFNVIAGIGYNENKFISGEASLIDKRVAGAPKNIYNLWVDYKIKEGFVKNIRVGFGGNHVGDVFWNASNTMTIPSYTIVNSAITYEKGLWSLGLKLNNLTNQKFWNSDAQPQALRNVVCTMSFKF
ncbi:TonB-dependent receptor [Flavobacterium psychrophilum]|uniref:Probable TonB-dependent outer membrane ferrichrome-iron receptor n=6 Tax=Flavobacterium psychrophilum TaxID=96345 RepID=A6H2D5_FLAPJ|nr:TonB-dependent receptor [Flavobacterium psychrophilum]AIG31178.1 TonB-dependent receptor [Flavobacterium psychrophilum]AIG33455.1 TonB-dependent receptor [Flavobacterium psychrophilum]AIG35606.1 TonB-dependent receptor [Flavobacterium psychrophilum]AIG37966.1 TonB-dependent receptor [Flavobacterium psychrophilum]AIG40237.1 TonB-dependent receptor [Flavobacterium psychrophilum]